MVIEQAGNYFQHSDNLFWKIIIILSGLIFLSLLILAFIYPLISRKPKDVSVQVHKPSTPPVDEMILPAYKNIAVALDFTYMDQQLLAHAIRQAEKQTTIILIHIVESASALVLGKEADDFESRSDQERLDEYVQFLQQKGFRAESRLGFYDRNKEIPRLVKDTEAELLVIGSHGHKGVKDWLYGETIDTVRHQLKIPVLIVSS
jgi:manganese transport protein